MKTSIVLLAVPFSLVGGFWFSNWSATTSEALIAVAVASSHSDLSADPAALKIGIVLS